MDRVLGASEPEVIHEGSDLQISMIMVQLVINCGYKSSELNT